LGAQAAGRSSGESVNGGWDQRADGAQGAKIPVKALAHGAVCLPPEQSVAFVCAIEDVRDVYARPHDPKRPLVCLDKFCKQPIADTHEPVAAHPGAHTIWSMGRLALNSKARELAEIEIGVAQRQCLDRRLGSQQEVERELLGWAAGRNESYYSTDWRLTTKDARIELKHLHPSARLK
jgi:hypothetical protein